MLIMGVFTLALADEEKRLVPAEMIGRLRSEAGVWFTSAGIFLISAVPVFGRSELGVLLVNGLSFREFLWVGALIISWVRGRGLVSKGTG